MELPSYFKEFLTHIRPTSNQRDEMKTGYSTLRNRLRSEEDLKGIYVADFLQGSYRRQTAIKPRGGTRSDVDLIVVTNLKELDYTPRKAMALFKPFLDKYYEGKWEYQGRSMGIKLSYVDLDLVITSAPSEADKVKLNAASVNYIGDVESAPDWALNDIWLPQDQRYNFSNSTAELSSAPEWKLEPLRIPDREANEWDDTHPLEQIRWTHSKNRECNTHYINVVKAIKWWRRITDSLPKYPKGYPLEHLVGNCCPNDIRSVADGVVLSLESIVKSYETDALLKRTPILPDRGVPEHNVFHRVSGEDFAAFYEGVKDAAKTAREALDEQGKNKSVEKWQSLFGDEFPKRTADDSDSDDGGDTGKESPGYSAPKRQSAPGSGSFA